MEDIKDKYAYERAKKRVREIRSFYMNLLCYCIVIRALIIINIIYTPEYYWFPFSMIGWGIGLLLHGMTAFDKIPFFNRDWEERKMRELIEKEKQKQQSLNKFQ